MGLVFRVVKIRGKGQTCSEANHEIDDAYYMYIEGIMLPGPVFHIDHHLLPLNPVDQPWEELAL